MRQWHAGGVDVELVQSAVGIVAGAVGIIGPGRVGDAAVERESGVIAEINAVVGVVRVGSAGADLDVPGKRLAAIGAEGAPDLGVVIGDAIGIARPPGAEIVARVVPAHGEVAAGGVERDFGQELAVGSAVIVHAHAGVPGGAIIVGIADEDVEVVAVIFQFARVHKIDAAVVRASGAVPGQARLGVNRAMELSRNVIEAADVGLSDEGAVIAEGRGPEAIGIDIDPDFAATGASFRGGADW